MELAKWNQHKSVDVFYNLREIANLCSYGFVCLSFSHMYTHIQLCLCHLCACVCVSMSEAWVFVVAHAVPHSLNSAT